MIEDHDQVLDIDVLNSFLNENLDIISGAQPGIDFSMSLRQTFLDLKPEHSNHDVENRWWYSRPVARQVI